jgi:hypothetical protein
VAVPSFVEGLLRGRGWIEQALCRQAPHDALPWIMEASAGKLPPVATPRLLDGCARCPVRWECLLDAVLERAFTVTGCWGGSMTTERVAVVEQERRRLKAERTPEPIVFERSGFDQEPGSPVPSHERLTERDEHEDPSCAAAILEASFAERLESWQRRAQEHRRTRGLMPRPCKRCGVEFEPSTRLQLYCAKRCQASTTPVAAAAPLPARSVCRRCGGRLGWWQRADAAYCSAACKQAAYRFRAAA